jgi:hypothetical protein
MKKLIGTITSLVIAMGLCFAQCNPYYNFKEGSTMEMSSYSAKGKLEGRTQMKAKNVKKSGDNYTMMMEMRLIDEKGKEVMATEYGMECDNGVVRIDARKFALPQESAMAGVGDITIEFEGDMLEMPGSLSVGQRLKDAKFSFRLVSDNPALAMMAKNPTESTIYDRKVEAKEVLKTAAGSFDCFKITSSFRSDVKIMGMSRTVEMSTVEWIAENVGVIRSENYDKKGKMTGYTELSAYSL